MVEEGVEWARRAAALGNENYPLFASSHRLDGLRHDPRFAELLEQLRRLWESRRGSTSGDRTDTQDGQGGEE
jgi:alkanesulfonate monooxygenase SsuD/methylene tetrahydromethanopterin reductase-like flavin-dependent oxidoreductase (luciferase family)